MMSLWFTLVLLALLGAIFVVIPFIRKSDKAATDLTQSSGENAQRIDIYHQRLAELDDDVQLSKISLEDFSSAVIELKKGLLNELSPEKKLNVKGNNLTLLLAGSLFLLSFTAIFYYATGNYSQLNQWQKAQVALPELGKRAMMQQGEPLTANELQQFALGLRTKIAKQGEDEMAWMLLGQVNMSLGDYKSAMQAFDKTLSLNSRNVTVLLNYTQLLLMSGEPDYNQAGTMLSTILSVEPSNFDAISLLGLIAYERGDFLEAKAAFDMLLSSMSKDDERYAMIKFRVKELVGKISSLPAKPLNNHAMATNIQSNSSVEASLYKIEQNSTGHDNAIKVKIELADHLVDKTPNNATLFVFAKAVAGPKMPLAVVKQSQFSFPLEITLSEKNAMVAELSLAQFEQVIITVRVSVDENVMSAAGELQGKSDTIEVKNSPEVTVVVDQLL
ncbi:c-type cytochrome biogenesis protein CcmI [Pseudoalteromonas sp. NBT06-2]|uniref:c-type cytochrome biogenesis protein CcmI n=1 Tax=Pseudoalteromonas sp. NBT06-2 TaxID=2025950 RepID=UPI000BA7C42F|nr:c-type cytochrome biogenesis protein CcmI [Pseudoalteromonas sp. NBT06-2]PAJ74637.1 c-type cytochrome biogenesis protein CcmI [Pseudoalteromonas sp. NBT06-2]